MGSRRFPLVFLAACITWSGGCANKDSTVTKERFHRNLFHEHLGKSDAEVEQKLADAWNHYFYGDEVNERVYYPIDEDMAYILDVGNGDVRSEGISYGMMIAVQMNKQDEFNRLWKWADTFMRHKSGPLEGFFAWHCLPDGTRLDQGPASDGEEWIAMALFFAANRWGSGAGLFDYKAQANQVLKAMLERREEPDGEVFSMWDLEAKIIRFVPGRNWSKVTDPSYHLPAFYELWSRWADENQSFWAEAAGVSREFFHQAAHAETGLMADYTYFDGRPFVHNGHEDFRFDAWRNFSNVALDYAWWGKDPWQIEQSNRVLNFLGRIDGPIPNQMKLDGTPLSETASGGLYYMAATAGLASDTLLAKPFVEKLWDSSFEEGKWRYYDGLLQMLALLQVSGRFQVWEPQS